MLRTEIVSVSVDLKAQSISNSQHHEFKLSKNQYLDIAEPDRTAFQNYARSIWNFPLLHPTTTQFAAAKWKQWLRKSFIAHKSGIYNKHIFKYGQHKRQQIAVYTPTIKNEIPLRVVYFVHGGDLVNGCEESFEFLAKQYVQNGYILVVSGFRQSSDAKFQDCFDDIHLGYLKSLEVLANLGGRLDEMTILSWSGSGLFVLRNLRKYQEKYENNVKTFISLASSFEPTEHTKKFHSAFLNNSNEEKDLYVGGYEKLNINQQIVLVITRHESSEISHQNVKYNELLKQKGVPKVKLEIVENHDHYDLINNEHLSLSFIRQSQLDRIAFHNELSDLLFNDKPERKEVLFELAKDPIFIPIYDASLYEQKHRTIKQFETIMRTMKVKDLANNLGDTFTKNDVLGLITPGAMVKIMTHFSTAVGTIVQNGTERHQKYLEMVDAGKMVCAFGMTELMGGNNIGECGTTATYDHKTKEFIFHNETYYTMKFWAASLGYHANYTVLFAKTFVNNKNEGINAFVVPIRDANSNPFKGVIVRDFGHKTAVNSIDNGYLMFDNYRVSAECLLNKYNNIDENGVFHSNDSIHARFFKTIERLLLGRICVISIVFSCFRASLYVCTKFSRKRIGVASNGQSQLPIFTYQVQQNSIVPTVAKGFIYQFLLSYSKNLFVNEPKHPELSNVCNVVKLLISDFGARSLIQMRERMGGLGLISNNRISEWIGLQHACLTGEGDNRVISNKVAKDLIRMVTNKTLSIPKIDKLVITSIGQLDSLQNLFTLFKIKEAEQFKNLFKRVQDLKKEGKSFFETIMFHTAEECDALVNAYGERIAFEQSIEALGKLKQKQNIHALTTMFRIGGLTYLQDNLSFFLIHGVIGAEVGAKVRQKLNSEIKMGSRYVEYLVENWNIPKDSLYVPILGDYGKYYSEHHNGEVINARL